MESLLEKYCQPLSRYERTILTRYWLNLHKYRNSFYPILCSIYFSNKSPSLLLQFIFLITEAINYIKNEIKSLNIENRDNLISAYSAFFSLITIYLVNYDFNIEELKIKVKYLSKYVLLYVIVDHTLDADPSQLKIFKLLFDKIIDSSNNNLKFPNDKLEIPDDKDISRPTLNNEDISPLIKRTILYLKELIVYSPKSLPHIIKAAELEFKSIEIQYSGHNSLKLCYEKGKTSAIAGCSILADGNILDGADIMGHLGQLYDDITDLHKDIDDGIITFVTEAYCQNKNIDSVIDIFASEFEKLPSKYNWVKPTILHMVSTFLFNSDYISEEKRLIFQKYSLLFQRGNSGSESLFYFLF